MNNRIDDRAACAEFDSIIELAVGNKERFIIERRGEPAVVMLSVRDFIETLSPAPGWLETAWQGAT